MGSTIAIASSLSVAVLAEPTGVKNMKRLVIVVSLLLLAAAIVSLEPKYAHGANAPELSAKSDNQSPPANPLKVALLKWYRANKITDFEVGKQPLGVAFDGANIWVANNDDSTLSKLRASDGADLGTFPVGGAPIGLAFDGANIWVANSSDNTVSKLRASDGKTLGTFRVGKVPWFLAFDGEAIWVTNSQDFSVTKLRASDGKTLGTFPDSEAPGGIAFDGTYVWVSNGHGTVTRFKRDGEQAGTFSVGLSPVGLAFDGADIWVANNGDGTVTKLRASDGKNLGTFPVNGGAPYGLAFDGANIWVGAGPWIVELQRSDGAILTALAPPCCAAGVAFDGANIWVARTRGFVSKL